MKREKTKMELTLEHMLQTYKPEMIMNDMVKEVILHDSYERYLFKPSQIELNWLICRLRYEVADEELSKETKKQDELEWHNWIYNS